jgi:hypothetical protein
MIPKGTLTAGMNIYIVHGLDGGATPALESYEVVTAGGGRIYATMRSIDRRYTETKRVAIFDIERKYNTSPEGAIEAFIKKLADTIDAFNRGIEAAKSGMMAASKMLEEYHNAP